MKAPPVIVIELPLEDRPLVRIVSATDGDEARLRVWASEDRVDELLGDAARVVDEWREAA